jgi:HEPN domain-containing protein
LEASNRISTNVPANQGTGVPLVASEMQERSMESYPIDFAAAADEMGKRSMEISPNDSINGSIKLRQVAEKAELVLKWIGWADNDYVAARLLLRQGLLTQGAILANTALEKYMKSISIALNINIPRSCHDITKLYSPIIEEIPRLKTLNEEFLGLLFKTYQLRYPDGLKAGFNIVLNNVSLLAELDKSVFEIKKGLRVERASKKIVTTIFDMWKEAAWDGLVGDNCYFGTTNRAELFNRTSTYYEFRFFSSGNIMEITYRSKIQDDGKFMHEGIRAKTPDYREFTVVGMPIT